LGTEAVRDTAACWPNEVPAVEDAVRLGALIESADDERGGTSDSEGEGLGAASRRATTASEDWAEADAERSDPIA
jgi:hypothetical protein